MFEIHKSKFHVIINHEITVLAKKTNEYIYELFHVYFTSLHCV